MFKFLGVLAKHRQNGIQLFSFFNEGVQLRNIHAYFCIRREIMTIFTRVFSPSRRRYYTNIEVIFSNISKRNNDYSDTLDFRKDERGRSRFSFWRSLITNPQCLYIYDQVQRRGIVHQNINFEILDDFT